MSAHHKAITDIATSGEKVGDILRHQVGMSLTRRPNIENRAVFNVVVWKRMANDKKFFHRIKRPIHANEATLLAEMLPEIMEAMDVASMIPQDNGLSDND